MAFIFGGDTGVSYDALKRQQDNAQRMLDQSMAGASNVPEGIRAIGLALMGRQAQKRADKMRQDLIGQLAPEDIEKQRQASLRELLRSL